MNEKKKTKKESACEESAIIHCKKMDEDFVFRDNNEAEY
jgi:hypothetical protein